MDRMIQVLKNFIFWSRWLQAPLYLGLIVAQGVYVYQFMIELSHLVAKAGRLTDTDIMLIVLGLIDVVMIANLLNIVIIGGYEPSSRGSPSRATRISPSGCRTSAPVCSRSNWPRP